MKFYQDWQGCIYEDNMKLEWFQANVPGNIQYDYGVFHDFGDPDYMDNYLKYLPLEDLTWAYKTKLNYDRKEDESLWFVSLGIDYSYDILINDKKIYSYEGMYKGVELNLTEYLTGEDELKIIIYPHPKKEGAFAGTRDEATGACKPLVTYGMDFNPRLLSSGLWQEAYIETRKADYIQFCEPIVKLDDSMTNGSVDFEILCNGNYVIQITDAEGNVVYRGQDTHVEIKNPNLWWCNGQGVPYLYHWTVQSESDIKQGRFGFKKLRLVRNEGAIDPPSYPKSRYDAPITIELNGRRILAKGTDFVNPELFFGHINRQTYEPLVATAREAHMNIFRVWGLAGLHKEVLYDLCDEAGILIWQEFPLGCGLYPDTKEYLAVLESEAIAMIKLLRHHASLAIWCGGNELFNGWSGMDDQALALRLLDKLCYEYDYGRPFLKTSPEMGMAHGGYKFVHPEMNGDIFHNIRNSYYTAYPEFGISGMTDVETLKKMIPEEELFPIRETEAWIGRHGLQSWEADSWVCQPILEQYYGKAESLEQLVEQSEKMQCIGYQALFEGMRQQWPHCSVMMNWCYNEPWSNAANNCIVSYPARPRKAYYAVKNALRPTIFSASIDHYDWKETDKFSADIWLLNDRPEKVCGKVVVELVTEEEIIKLLDWECVAEANSNVQGPTIHTILPLSDGDFFKLRLRSEEGMENEYELLLRHIPRDEPKLKQLNH